MGEYDWAICCAMYGQWQDASAPNARRLRNAMVVHDPRCDGRCPAYRTTEERRAEGIIIGEPVYRWQLNGKPKSPRESVFLMSEHDLAATRFCVNCKHHRPQHPLYGPTFGYHWCSSGVSLIDGATELVKCGSNRYHQVPFVNGTSHDSSTIDPCGHRAKFFEPREDGEVT
jgi:hypothetical protein